MVRCIVSMVDYTSIYHQFFHSFTEEEMIKQGDVSDPFPLIGAGKVSFKSIPGHGEVEVIHSLLDCLGVVSIPDEVSIDITSPEHSITVIVQNDIPYNRKSFGKFFTVDGK